MTYHDPDSGLDFASEEEYREAREPRERPTDDDLCAAGGHEYVGDDGDRGRCYCGAQPYPKGGPAKHETRVDWCGVPSGDGHRARCSCGWMGDPTPIQAVAQLDCSKHEDSVKEQQVA